VAVSRLAVALGALVLLALPAASEGANGNANYHAVCPSPPSGFGHCHALVVTDSQGNPQATGAPTGLSPATIDSVYGFPGGTAGAGQTVAIVDAYDDPTAASDLATFSSQFGLPPCSTGCFSKVNQTGGTSYPSSNSSWALEISLDVQWAHAIAPGAHILLVEANSNSFDNLLAAEDYAAAHATYVSNSWGGNEFSGENGYDSHFLHSGVSYFVSAGDAGLPAEYPSASPNVISVGGTTLTFNGDGSLNSETGWSAGGGGCSSYENANPSQSTGQVNCSGKRATPDVSLDADPASGVAVYDTTRYSGQSGWFQVGGTSASSPMWAAASADQGAVVNAAYVYGNAITFRDITAGNNGAPCLVGFDLCTGRGSWLFASSPPPPPQAFLGFTGTQTLTAGQTAQKTATVSTVQPNAISVTLSTSSSGGGFSATSSGPFSSPFTVTIPANATSSATFYYSDTRAGTATLTDTASGYTSGTQTETVSAAALATITVSPATATVTVGGTQTFAATGADAYGNPVPVSSASWTTNAPGTVSPATGSSTVFTAGSSAGSGSVTATVGSVSNFASVSVTGLFAPSNLVASQQGKHISLTWQSSDTGVTYNVYRGTAPGAELPTPYASGLTSTTMNDMSVSSGTTYWYYVTAVGPGGESTHSNETSARAR
jgi:subtilase family serine protease